MSGSFVISLDFELMWGMIEKINNSSIKEKVKNVHIVIPKILNLFRTYDIHATWGLVGLILFENKKELDNTINDINFNYKNSQLNVYNYVNSYKDKPFPENLHFGLNLVKKIVSTKNQEIASHSFSHFYSNEEGQNDKDFDKDLKLFNAILKSKLNIETNTYIHPRFQYNKDYDEVLLDNGYKAYRGLRDDKLKDSKLSEMIKRKMKYFDRYINLLGHRSYDINNIHEEKLLNVKESYYLRPYNKKKKLLEFFKLRRVKNEMTYAAKNEKIFHLWWHPHDFGLNIDENISILEKILKHYKYLQYKYDYRSRNMIELLSEINTEH